MMEKESISHSTTLDTEETPKRVYQLDSNQRPRQFTIALDTGLKRTSKGSKVFAVLDGALAAGLNLPYSTKCLVGYDGSCRDRKDRSYEPEVTTEHTYGIRVFKIMDRLKDEPEQYNRQFANYNLHGVTRHELAEL